MSDELVHDKQPSPDAFSERRVSRLQALTTAALLLILYIAGSSVLGLSVGWLFEGPVFLLRAWSTNVGADVVFIIGSIAGAVGGVTLAKRSVGLSIVLAALITWAT